MMIYYKYYWDADFLLYLIICNLTSHATWRISAFRHHLGPGQTAPVYRKTCQGWQGEPWYRWWWYCLSASPCLASGMVILGPSSSIYVKNQLPAQFQSLANFYTSLKNRRRWPMIEQSVRNAVPVLYMELQTGNFHVVCLPTQLNMSEIFDPWTIWTHQLKSISGKHLSVHRIHRLLKEFSSFEGCFLRFFLATEVGNSHYWW